MRLFAFEGIHYTPKAGHAGDTGPLAAPPYDQINEEARDRFHAQDPHQFVHLTRPVAPEGGDPYRFAAALHHKWLDEGVLARDGQPALYPYVIELAGGGQRLGVLGLAGLEDATVIRPHEQTLDKPLADRLALLSAMQVDLEPVFLLSEDEGRLDALIAEDTAASPALVRHQDADGHLHVVYRVDDPERIRLYQQATSGPAAIADGHHRYKVAQKFASERGIRPGTAASAKLAVVTSIAAPGLSIEPIHRALREEIDLAKIAHLEASSIPFQGSSGSEFAQALAEIPEAQQPAIGIWKAGRTPEIWLLDTTVRNLHSPGKPLLTVEILHEIILPALGYSPDAGTDGTVVYRSNPEELWQQVANGELKTGLWLPPMLPAAFSTAIAGGQMLPPKSTRFMPKVMSGLVWADHDSRIL
ncbi:MAG TPA: DUF1015 domain-containing protein [Thermoanaerobaculia bacterium]|jgi:uncharacterized protein (DUF1015 family)|nr:DUF1015 domain-containing protein [Thermoanaerobaculia bacterium]